MTYTYTDPSNSNADLVRFLVGDTVEDAVSLQDEEIAALLSIYGNVTKAALFAAYHVRAKIARLPQSRTVAGSTTQRTVSDMDLVIRNLERQANGRRGGISIFGLTETDRDLIEDDSDFLQPFAKSGRDHNT